MLEIIEYNSANLPKAEEELKAVDFLFDALGAFTDPKYQIQMAIDYALG